MSKQPQVRFFIIVVLIAVIGIAGYYILNAPDQRGMGEKIDDAIDELPNDPDAAVRELEDRTPAEKLGDAVEDAGDDIEDSTDQ